MKLHLGSFLLGVAVGATGAAAAKRFRPVAVELVSLGYRLADAVEARLAVGRETVEDLFAEARARARGLVRREPAEAAPGAIPRSEAA
jgi:hypothetical protein